MYFVMFILYLEKMPCSILAKAQDAIFLEPLGFNWPEEFCQVVKLI